MMIMFKLLVLNFDIASARNVPKHDTVASYCKQSAKKSKLIGGHSLLK